MCRPCLETKTIPEIIYRNQIWHHLTLSVISVEKGEAFCLNKVRQLSVCDWVALHFKNTFIGLLTCNQFSQWLSDTWGLVIQCIYRDLCGYPQCMTGDLAKVLDCLIPTLNMCLEFQPRMPSWWDSGITFFHNCPARWAVSREVTLPLSPVFLIGAGIQDGSREEDDICWVTSPYQAPCWCVPSVCPV